MILDQLFKAINEGNEGAKQQLLINLQESSRNVDFLSHFDKPDVTKLITLISVSEQKNIDNQLILVSLLCNVLFINEDLRNDVNNEIPYLNLLPSLNILFEIVGEHEIFTEEQYKSYLPIFRLVFLLTFNKHLLLNLHDTVLKISGKLLNFISLCDVQTSALNKLIVEILKIKYSYIHQMEITEGLDSYFVLSCNKFNLLYKNSSSESQDYDEILHHFGNILVSIPTNVSKNYMLNKKTFAVNQVNYLNRLSSNNTSTNNNLIPVSNLLVLDILITIDEADTATPTSEKFEFSSLNFTALNGDNNDYGIVADFIRNNLNFESLSNLNIIDPNFKVTLHYLQNRLSSPTVLNTVDDSNSNSKNELVQQIASADGVIRKSSDGSYAATDSSAFDEMTEEEKEKEVDRINDIFDKIEKNGVFKIKTQI